MPSLMYSRTLGLLLLALAIPDWSSLEAAETKQEPKKGNQAAPTPPQPQPRNPRAIDIKVETFLKQIVPGAIVSVVADITNDSRAPVWFRSNDIQLIFSQEVERRGAWNAWFPTEGDVKQEICLKESETYRVFFWMGEEPATGAAWFKQKGQFLKHWAQYFTFVPGTYPITVEAKYWDNDDFTGSDYHTAFETKTVEYSAPQSIILVGAVLGGFIFTFLSIVRAEQNAMSGAPAGWLNIDKGKKLLTFVGSALLSAIITILLSRIGETQFFIKVSVSDFWGAIATGFLANYGGWALLDKMIPVKNKGGEEKK